VCASGTTVGHAPQPLIGCSKSQSRTESERERVRERVLFLNRLSAAAVSLCYSVRERISWSAVRNSARYVFNGRAD